MCLTLVSHVREGHWKTESLYTTIWISQENSADNHRCGTVVSIPAISYSNALNGKLDQRTAHIIIGLISSIEGNKGDKWLNLRVPIAAQTSRWQLIVQATQGTGSFGDIAIDDFQLDDGPCLNQINKDPGQ